MSTETTQTVTTVPHPTGVETVMEFPFPLSDFQVESIKAIHRDENVLVTAKTGSGKTLVGVYQAAYSLKKGMRVFYTTPIKALSNDKIREIKNTFPEASVGIMTGDKKDNPSADIVIMTAEILRNLLYKKGTSTEGHGLTAGLTLDRVDAVIVDEAHYINDKGRGHVWEETLILLPKEIKVILLSATLNQPSAFADWLSTVRERPTNLIETPYRVVPLTHYAAKIDATGELQLTEICATNSTGSEVYDPVAYKKWSHSKYLDYKKEREFREQTAARKADVLAVKAAAKAAGEAIPHGLPAAEGKVHQTSYIHQLNTTIKGLEARDMLPAIFFVFNRKQCEQFADAVETSLLEPSQAAAVRHTIDFHLQPYKETLSTVHQYHNLIDLLQKGVAYHHSGLLPLLKEMVEILFSRGLIKVLFCTETFAVGINMPTRTVVFTELRKHDNGGLRTLRKDEYIQMAGRAGRRGKDVRGNVIYLPSHAPVYPEEMQTLMTGNLPTLESRISFSYEFILKTIHAGEDTWKHVMNNSYWFRLEQQEVNKLAKELNKTISDCQKFATANHLSEQATIDTLTELERLRAEFKSAVNADKKKAQATLNRFESHLLGAKWATAMEAWSAFKKMRIHADQLNTQYQTAKEHLDDLRTVIQPAVSFLQEHGYLETDSMKLTPKGVIATEVNEGHPILMTELYMTGALDSLNPTQIMGVLAAFITERSSQDDQLNSVRDDIQPIIQQLVHIRDSFGSGEEWRLSTEYVDIALDWMAGEPASEICSKYNIYEGNLTRIIMKLNNLLEELRVLATITNNVTLLNTIKDLIIVHGIAVPDSLYMRM